MTGDTEGATLPGFTVEVVRFEPHRASEPRRLVASIAELHAVLAPYVHQERLVVYLDHDGGARGSVWLHLTGDRAWVTHFTEPGGEDSYCRDANYTGPDETVGFLLSNGQLDHIHRSWTVSRGDGLEALDFFLLYGIRYPNLNWVSQPESLQESANLRG